MTPSSPPPVLPRDRKRECTIEDRSGAKIAEGLRCAVWPVTSTSSRVGEQYDFEGYVFGVEAREALEFKRNRVMVVAGEARFNVVAATYYPILNYVGVKLRRVLPDG